MIWSDDGSYCHDIDRAVILALCLVILSLGLLTLPPMLLLGSDEEMLLSPSPSSTSTASASCGKSGYVGEGGENEESWGSYEESEGEEGSCAGYGECLMPTCSADFTMKWWIPRELSSLGDQDTRREALPSCARPPPFKSMAILSQSFDVTVMPSGIMVLFLAAL